MRAAALLLCCLLLAACGPRCDGVYVIAQGRQAGDALPGRLTPGQVPAELPRRLLSADGAYAGTKAYCSVDAARSDYLDSARAGRVTVPGAWSIWRTDARWPDDVYPYREADWRLKAPARLQKEEETHGSGN